VNDEYLMNRSMKNRLGTDHILAGYRY